MTDPRIEIAARALRQIEHMLGVALSDAEHGSGPDHDPGQIMCDAMGDARELAFEAYRATLDAARPEVDGDAVVEAAMDPEADAVWRMIYDACTGGNGATGFRIFQRALTAARAPAAPDENAKRGAVKQMLWEATRRINELEPNALPMNELPEGWGFADLVALEDGFGVSLYLLSRQVASQLANGSGPTPRAAMLAAIAAAKDAKPGGGAGGE